MSVDTDFNVLFHKSYTFKKQIKKP